MKIANLQTVGVILIMACIFASIVVFVGGFWYVGIGFLVCAAVVLIDYVAAHLENKKNLEDDECEEEEAEDLDETWELEKLAPNIFMLSCGNSYDLAMRFLRFQEFYESPNDDFRGEPFTLIEYMDWYAKDNGLVFSYPDDWSGFNVPGWVFGKLLDGDLIEDWNGYDEFMYAIVQDIREQIEGDDPDHFYLIGVKKGDEEVIDHELAHAFYCAYPKYKTEMDQLTERLFLGKKDIYQTLKRMGYTSEVLADELQAYFSTGLTEELRVTLENSWYFQNRKDIEEPFKNVFQRWKNFYIK